MFGAKFRAYINMENVMNNVISKFLFLIIITQVFTQTNLTTKQWQNDLLHLQKTIHSNYNNLFIKITKNEFDEKVEKIHTQIPRMESHEIKVAFAELIALFGYGHTNIQLNAWQDNPTIDFSQLPLKLYAFKDGIFIQGVHKNYKKALGAKVLRIGKYSSEDAFNKIRPSVSAENDQFFRGFGILYLAIPEILHAKGVISDINSVPFLLEKDGKTFEMTFTGIKSSSFPGHFLFIQNNGDWLDARQAGKSPLWLKEIHKGYFFEHLPKSKTVYVRQSTVVNESERISAFYERVFDRVEKPDVERLIIDLRLNSGGNNANNKDVIVKIMQSKKINQKGRLFVIIGRNTFSATQNLVNEMEHYTEAIFVGEPTAENVNFMGDARFEELPNSKIHVRLSHAWWQDKPAWDKRPWLEPDYTVELSFEDYRTNKDPVLETIDIAQKLEHKLVNFFAEQKNEINLNKLKSIVTDKKYSFYNFEFRLNAEAYNHVRTENLALAYKLFKLNTELFADHQNVWDSFAEINWRLGKKDLAIKYYNKAIAFDPNSRLAANSRNMLRRIKGN